LKQFFEDAVWHSHEGTGTFEIYPLSPNHVADGWISLYYSRANSLFKSLSNQSLLKIGIRHQQRRNGYDDEYGTALPRYSYELTCAVCLIKDL
jgi:hypothetical protein